MSSTWAMRSPMVRSSAESAGSPEPRSSRRARIATCFSSASRESAPAPGRSAWSMRWTSVRSMSSIGLSCGAAPPGGSGSAGGVEPLDEAVEAFRRRAADGDARLLGEPVELLRQGVDAPGDVARGVGRTLAAEAVELARQPVEAALELPCVELAATDLRQALVQLGELSRELLDALRLGHVGQEAANVEELLRQAVDDLGVDAAARDRLDTARERLELARQAAMDAARHELGDAADLGLELLDRTAHRREVARGAGVRDLGRDAAKRALERVDLVAGREPADHGLQ